MIQRTIAPPLPTNVTFSDSVAHLAETLLGRSGYRSLQRVHCEYVAGTLTLRGQVPSFYMKQVAQTVVKSLRGVTLIDNRLEVHETDHSGVF